MLKVELEDATRMGAGLWVFLMSSPSHRLNTEENALMLPGTFMNTVPVPVFSMLNVDASRLLASRYHTVQRHREV